MRCSLLWLAAILLLPMAQAQAQFWTVQTAAFQDYRQALSQVDQLLDLGFDAYSEFTMSNGQQYSRVRIGCFAGRSAAEAFASDLSGAVTAEAVPQPLSEGASVTACVDWDVGFVKPREWSIERRRPDILFRVEVGGQVGFLRHTGAGWEFTHSSPAPLLAPAEQSVDFVEVEIGGVTLVQARPRGGDPVNACGGQLLWQSGRVAVVERSDSVIACVVDYSPPVGSP
ncbi:MAG TPA: SPOR domain-containing protein [Trueperaceae bacterium]